MFRGILSHESDYRDTRIAELFHVCVFIIDDYDKYVHNYVFVACISEYFSFWLNPNHYSATLLTCRLEKNDTSLSFYYYKYSNVNHAKRILTLAFRTARLAMEIFLYVCNICRHFMVLRVQIY